MAIPDLDLKRFNYTLTFKFWLLLVLVVSGIELANGQCNGTFLAVRGQNGTVSNPNFPQPYASNQLCDWQIAVEPGFKIGLTAETFAIQTTCNGCDYVSIRDGSSFNDRELNKLFRPSLRHTTTTSSNKAYIRWRTDSSGYGNGTTYGFKVHYFAILKNKAKLNVDSHIAPIWLIVLLGALLAILLSILAIVLLISKRRQRIRLRRNKASSYVFESVGNADDEDERRCYITPAPDFFAFLHGLGEAQLCDDLSALAVSPDSLDVGDVIGLGNFGVVHEGILKTDEGVVQKVAVKIVKSTRVEDIVDFVKEATVMATFDHANVMTLMGIAIINETPHILFPLMAKGNLKNYLNHLEDIEKRQLKERQLLEFARQICDGMLYVTDRGCIHRDLAARNVLVSEELQLKIGDFGLGRSLDNSGYYKCRKDKPIPVRWHPPESFYMNVFDVRSDVWSFGVVCWEIFTFCQDDPYGDLNVDEVGVFIQKGNRLPCPKNCPNKTYVEIMTKCWHQDRFQRPSFAELLIEINRLITVSDQFDVSNDNSSPTI